MYEPTAKFVFVRLIFITQHYISEVSRQLEREEVAIRLVSMSKRRRNEFETNRIDFGSIYFPCHVSHWLEYCQGRVAFISPNAGKMPAKRGVAMAPGDGRVGNTVQHEYITGMPTSQARRRSIR